MKMRVILVGLALAGLVSCGDSGPELDVAPADDAPDWDELRRRLNVLVRDSAGDESELTPTVFVEEVQAECASELGSSGPLKGCSGRFQASLQPHLPPSGAPSVCVEAMCDAQLRVCVANRLMELAETPAPATVGVFTVPPQSRATRTGLAEMAIDVAREAIVSSGEALRAAAGHPAVASACVKSHLADDDWQTDITDDPPTVGEMLGTSLVESYWLMREATESAHEGNLAIADAQFSEQPSLARATRYAFTAPVLSRGHIAELIAGRFSDDPIEQAVPIAGTTPTCTSAPTTAAVEAAVGALRASALSPEELAALDGPAAIELDTLIVGSTPAGSVRERLETEYGVDLPETPGDFYREIGIDRGAWRDARDFLVQEQRVFRRSPTAKLSRRPLPTDGTPMVSPFDRFAATEVLPQRLPEGMQTALVRSGDTLRTLSGSYGNRVPDPEYARFSVSHAVDYAHTVVQGVLRPDFNGIVALDDATNEALSSLLAPSERERPARVAVRWDEYAPGSHSNLFVDVLGYPEEELRVVVGADALACATRGSIDGADCDLEDDGFPSGAIVATTYPASDGTGFTVKTQFEADDWDPVLTSGEPQELYVLHLPPGAVAQPGAFQYLFGTGLTTDTDTVAPANPWADALVDEAMALNPEDCTQPATSCAGIPFDQRIPLENELSEDGDAFESSWRTYLQLARRAADEADMLGEELIRNGLEMDRRAETAMEELETQCGSAIDIDGFATGEILGRQCWEGCAEGEACHSGHCVADPVDGVLSAAAEDDGPEAARLRACLGDLGPNRLVSLGSKLLCVWVNESNENDVCGGGPDAGPCPQYAPGDDCSGVSAPPGYRIEEVQPLGIFNSDASITGGGPERDPVARTQICDWFREYRAGNFTHYDDLVERGGPTFDPIALRDAARAISMEVEPYDLVTVDRGGDLWLSTGRVEDGVAITWPCGNASPPVTCGPGQTGLFCESGVDCSARLQRAEMTQRLAQAVVTARLITAAGMKGLRLPMFNGANEADHDGRRESARVASVLNAGDDLVWQPKVTIECRNGAGDNEGRYTSSSDWRARSYYEIDQSPDVPIWTSMPGADPLYATDNTPFVLYEMKNDQLRRSSVEVAAHIFDGFLGPRTIDRPRTDWSSLRLTERINLTRSGEAAYYGHELRDLTRYWNQTDRRDCAPHMERDNDAFLLPGGLRTRHVLDAMELLCESQIERLPGGGVDEIDVRCDPDNPPLVERVEQVEDLEDYLACVADKTEQRGELTVFANVPQVVIDVLRDEGGLGAVPATGGQFAEAVTRLRRGFVAMQGAEAMLASTIRYFAEDLNQLRLTIDSLETREKIQDIRLASAVSDRIASCAAAIGNASGADIGTAGKTAAAASVCANSVLQIALSTRERALNRMLLDDEAKQAFSRFTQTLEDRTSQVARIHQTVREAQEDIDGGLAALESIRRGASRDIAKALFADSDATGRVYRVNTVMRRRQNTLNERYQRARQYAVRMAFLAKLALEQRLGVELQNLEPPPGGFQLIEDPRSWHMQVCESSALDYQRIRESTDVEFESYAGSYVGDYVRRLEGVVEAYRLGFPFSDGSDTAVVSLRDDVTNTAAPCEIEV
ncbi:MAG TPA: hypothetical protein RMH85_20910 [Polyangiaceae bacterium LLY-WYZ-15_(1-7)]|nr:hypothetical protein [Polyangiaceae bacterium LLY-WYZ-15_(1-7)]HJL10948.1 hypothetical protein [Polyangiaceae bacterium LLY-WYZ-15_(1-7)]